MTTPVWLPYVSNSGSGVTYWINSSEEGSKLKIDEEVVSAIQSLPSSEKVTPFGVSSCIGNGYPSM